MALIVLDYICEKGQDAMVDILLQSVLSVEHLPWLCERPRECLLETLYKQVLLSAIPIPSSLSTQKTCATPYLLRKGKSSHLLVKGI